MKTAALLIEGIGEFVRALVTLALAIIGGLAIWALITNDELWEESWKCYSEGRIVAEGETRETPEWHGEGYSKLPDGRVVKGVCRW